MPIGIKTNIPSLTAQREASKSQNKVQSALKQLSSGLRVTSAAVDAAGLAISDKLTAQVRSLNQATRNANDGISLSQTADGAMNQVGDMLGRMRELAVQSSNGTLSSDDRSAIQEEMSSLQSEIDRISDTTEYNGEQLLDGSGSVELQVGSGGTTDDRISVSKPDLSAASLGSGTDPAGVGGVDVSTQSGAQDAIAVIDEAISDVSSARADNGATQNRLEVTISNLGAASENLTASRSRIRDLDYAEASSRVVANQIRQQMSLAVLAQANRAPQMAASLLGG
jgi:flagellin